MVVWNGIVRVRFLALLVLLAASFLTMPVVADGQGVEGASVVLTSSADPSLSGQSVTFTAAVSAVAPATGTPFRAVTWNACPCKCIGCDIEV